MFVTAGLLWHNFEKSPDYQVVVGCRSALLMRWASFCICLIACEFCKIQPDLSCRFFCLAMFCNTLAINAFCKVVPQLDYAISASMWGSWCLLYDKNLITDFACSVGQRLLCGSLTSYYYSCALASSPWQAHMHAQSRRPEAGLAYASRTGRIGCRDKNFINFTKPT